MNTRMAKYDEVEETTSSRVKRNSNLYNEINNTEISDFKMRSNATVIGNHNEEIDIEKIKKILDTRYKDAPKRKSIRIDDETEKEEKDEVPTKEYDLNVFLEKAKDEKEETYEEVRSKKLRDTQFDILKNLNIDSPEDEIEDQTEKRQARPEDNDLLNLINTITINENKEKEKKLNLNSDNVDKEEDNTISDETNKIEEIRSEIEKVEKTSTILNKTNELDNSFYTKTNVFKKKDLNNSIDEEEKTSIWLKIIIVLLIIGIGVGLFFFLKSIINF